MEINGFDCETMTHHYCKSVQFLVVVGTHFPYCVQIADTFVIFVYPHDWILSNLDTLASISAVKLYRCTKRETKTNIKNDGKCQHKQSNKKAFDTIE